MGLELGDGHGLGSEVGGLNEVKFYGWGVRLSGINRGQNQNTFIYPMGNPVFLFVLFFRIRQ